MPKFEEPDLATVHRLLQSMVGLHVVVAGDGMLDSYVYGKSSRISPEAPVQIVQIDREESLLGGAANVAKCLVALGAKVTLCCIVGEDAQGEQFLAEAKSLNIDTRFVLRDGSRPTTVKTRVIAGRQHLLRLDREGSTPHSPQVLKTLEDAVRSVAASTDAILLSDYAKGVLSESLCQTAIQSANRRPVVVDPKGTQWERYAGATILKPNWREAHSVVASRDSTVVSLTQSSDLDAEQLARQLRAGIRVENVLVTRGPHGVSLSYGDRENLSFHSRATAVVDEAGAGDALAAAACLALAAGCDVPLAAWLGNVAAGAKVGKLGTQTVLSHDMLEVLGERFPSSERKILSAAQAAQMAAALRTSGKKVVFTNGCFDILHPGHVTYLEDARRLGDALIVGINTDASVRRLKGPERPLNSEQNRARIIAGNGCIDAVVLFEEDTPLELIKAIKPDVLCKGADYKAKQDVVGWDVVESYGGRVALIPFLEGHSTTGLIEKIRREKNK